METLLTLSVGEYSSVEVLLHLVVALIGMTAVLLALTATTLPVQLRLPLFLAAVALGGAAWFESDVWQSWQEAFELAGTSYCVTGHLIADDYRIIAWSLGVPAILFSFGLLLRPPKTAARSHLGILGLAVLALGGVAPFSVVAAVIVLCFIGSLLIPRVAHTPSLKITLTLAFGSIAGGLLLSIFASRLPLGSEASTLLAHGEILRTVIDLFSLVVPALLLLIGTLRVSKADQQSAL